MVLGIAVPVLPPTIALLRIDHPAVVRATAIAYHRDNRDVALRRSFAEALRDRAAELSAEVRRRL